MNRLDDIIADVAYILDILMEYRNIIESGNCNICGRKKNCEYKPDYGMRYNCPFYEEMEGKP